MLRLSIYLAATIHGLLHTYAPSNIMLDKLRTRRGYKWATPVAFVLVPIYLAAAHLTTGLVGNGAPGLLNLVAALLCWNAIKFACMVPISLALLIKALVNESVGRSAA